MDIVSFDRFIRIMVVEGASFEEVDQEKKIEQNIKNIHCSVFIAYLQVVIEESFELTLAVSIKSGNTTF